MWVIAKYNSNEENLFVRNLKNKLQNIKIYNPKLIINCYKKNKIIKKKKSLLTNYLFFNVNEFEFSNNFEKIKNIRGLNYLFGGVKLYQQDAYKFINYCKLHEDKDGYIRQDFIELSLNKFYKFTSGPFINLIFNTAFSNNLLFKSDILKIKFPLKFG